MESAKYDRGYEMPYCNGAFHCLYGCERRLGSFIVHALASHSARLRSFARYFQADGVSILSPATTIGWNLGDLLSSIGFEEMAGTLILGRTQDSDRKRAMQGR